ncbi:MAG: hypothetical protein H6564_11245 [Lewinellaceae bacterium]|nr:hypothetical protein [Lewinellaceae bacterium]
MHSRTDILWKNTYLAGLHGLPGSSCPFAIVLHSRVSFISIMDNRLE